MIHPLKVLIFCELVPKVDGRHELLLKNKMLTFEPSTRKLNRGILGAIPSAEMFPSRLGICSTGTLKKPSPKAYLDEFKNRPW